MTRDIMNMVEFFQILSASDMLGFNDRIKAFVESYNNINKGCGCSRKARISNTENLYLETCKSLEQDFVLLFKQKLGVEKVMFFHNSGLFAEH